MSEDAGTSRIDTQGLTARWLPLGALIMGVLCTFGWVALLAGLFMGLDTDENGLAVTAALVVTVILAAILTIPARSAGTVVAVIGALLYAGIWAYLRVGFDRMMPDAVLFVLTGIFFVAPLVTGLAALTVGARRLKAV